MIEVGCVTSSEDFSVDCSGEDSGPGEGIASESSRFASFDSRVFGIVLVDSSRDVVCCGVGDAVLGKGEPDLAGFSEDEDTFLVGETGLGTLGSAEVSLEVSSEDLRVTGGKVGLGRSEEPLLTWGIGDPGLGITTRGLAFFFFGARGFGVSSGCFEISCVWDGGGKLPSSSFCATGGGESGCFKAGVETGFGISSWD